MRRRGASPQLRGGRGGAGPGLDPVHDRRGARRHPRGALPRRHPPGVGGRRGRRLGPRHRAVPGRRGRPLRRAARRAPLRHRRAATAPRAGPRAGHGERAAGPPRAARRPSRAFASSPGGPLRATARLAGSTSSTRASTPTTPRSGWPPRRPSRRLATRSDWISYSPHCLLICAGSERSPVAQLAEHSAVNRRVVGSSPTGGASHDRPCRRRATGPLVWCEESVSPSVNSIDRCTSSCPATDLDREGVLGGLTTPSSART